MPKYYEISEAAAKRAKDMNSYSDYAPGSATAGYRAMVDEAYALAEKQKARVDPMYHDKIDALVDRYARRLAENLNERNAIDARVPSILITGGGNFPVAKKAKQNAARDRNYGEYAEIEKLLDKIRSTGRGGISADDDLAVEKLTKKLEGMESQQAMMKAVNAYYRKHKTLEGCPELTAEQVEKVIELLLNNDKVLDFTTNVLQRSENMEDAQRQLQDALGRIENIARREIVEQGYEYPVTAQLTSAEFPLKEYDGFSLPAGEYTALRLVIGDGAGRNWWCVVYPPLCTAAAADLPQAAADAGMSDDDLGLITEENPGYVLKFRSLELWEQLRQWLGKR